MCLFVLLFGVNVGLIAGTPCLGIGILAVPNVSIS